MRVTNEERERMIAADRFVKIKFKKKKRRKKWEDKYQNEISIRNITILQWNLQTENKSYQVIGTEGQTTKKRCIESNDGIT